MPLCLPHSIQSRLVSICRIRRLKWCQQLKNMKKNNSVLACTAAALEIIKNMKYNQLFLCLHCNPSSGAERHTTIGNSISHRIGTVSTASLMNEWFALVAPSMTASGERHRKRRKNHSKIFRSSHHRRRRWSCFVCFSDDDDTNEFNSMSFWRWQRRSSLDSSSDLRKIHSSNEQKKNCKTQFFVHVVWFFSLKFY